MNTLPTGEALTGYRRTLAFIQGWIYVISGLWPVVHMASFEMVSGRKTDKWLVKTVGLLVAVVGFVLLRSRTRAVSDDIALVAAGSAGSLAAIDVWYGGKGRISRVYLLDAILQTTLAASWLPVLKASQSDKTPQA